MNRRGFLSSVGAAGAAALLSGCLQGETDAGEDEPVVDYEVRREEVDVEPLIEDSTATDVVFDDGGTEKVFQVFVTLSESSNLYLTQPWSQSNYKKEWYPPYWDWCPIAGFSPIDHFGDYPKTLALKRSGKGDGNENILAYKSSVETKHIYRTKKNPKEATVPLGFREGDRVRLVYDTEGDDQFRVIDEFTY